MKNNKGCTMINQKKNTRKVTTEALHKMKNKKSQAASTREQNG